MEKALIYQNILLGLLCFVISCEAQSEFASIDPEIQKKINDFINDIYLPATNNGGLTLTVVQNNSNVFTTGYGLADQENQQFVDNDTQFLIGSITKSITATVIVKALHEKFPELGEKVLDTPIRELVPNYNFTLNDRFRSEQVTFKDMLSHRVCLSRSDLQLLSDAINTTSEIAFRQRYAEESCGIRSEFQYNNQMYVMAAEIISNLMEQTFEDLVQDFFIELQMLNSSLARTSDDFISITNRAKPYYLKENVSYPANEDMIKRVVVYNSAGGLFTTANDMTKYLMLHLNLGKLGETQIIPVAAMTWITKAAIHIPVSMHKMTDNDQFIAASAYGLGLMLGTYNGWQYNLHGGFFPTYSSQLSLYPGLKIGIFISSNQAPIAVPMTILEIFIVDTLREHGNATEAAMKIWNKYKRLSPILNLKNTEAVAKFVEENSKVNVSESDSSIVGVYGSGNGGDLEVSEKLDEHSNTTRLYFKYGNWYHGWMKHIGNSTYRVEWDTDIFQDFYAFDANPVENFIRVKNGTLQFLNYKLKGMSWDPLAEFKHGVTLSSLPHIPWKNLSCENSLF